MILYALIHEAECRSVQFEYQFVLRAPYLESIWLFLYRQQKSPVNGAFLWLAGELGFEPRLAESESAVLPLDDSPMDLDLKTGSEHAADVVTR